MEIKLPKAVEIKEFTDAAKISDWAAKAIKIVQMAGIIDGKPDGSFDPAGGATRAEAAKIIKVLMEVK